MARIQSFSTGTTIIAQGDTDAVAYLVKSGWLQVQRKGKAGRTKKLRLGPGEIVGELGLAGVVGKRTATVTALTDCELEIIDRGALIRLVNGPGNRLVPLLAALFSRLQSSLIENHGHGQKSLFAVIEGMTVGAQKALCNEKREIDHLPWFFGSHTSPQSVIELFEDTHQADVMLADDRVYIRKQHVCIEPSESGGLHVRLLQHGDYCLVDGERIGYGSKSNIAPLDPGHHELSFGHSDTPFQFSVEVPAP